MTPPPPRSAPLSSMWSLITLGLLSALAGLVIWLLTRPADAPSSAPQSVGRVTYCRSLPRFAAALGFSNQIVLTTSEPRVKGLVMVEPSATPGTSRVYQHPSWDDAGYLGPLALDREGNLYIAPVPRVSLLDNPPGKQNIIYRIDTDTGEMTEFMDLPAPAPPSPDNPFGIMGLAYDCDTNSLYVASVAGSARDSEVGRIVRIDPSTRTVVDHLDHIDAIGIGVFNGAHGKRLYFGSARAPDLRSVALDAGGDFSGEPRFELSIAQLTGGQDKKARRISFDPSGSMLVYAVEFNFNLEASSEATQTLHRLRYNAEQDAFEPETAPR